MFTINYFIFNYGYYILKLSGWGKFPVLDTELVTPKNIDELIKSLKKGHSIARGNGRSYGDSSIGKNFTISMKNFNQIISFDEKTGLITAESGILLKDIINFSLPKGWFLFVTPGTKFVTLGGMIAADIHGKNHHIEGNFSRYVEWIDVLNSDGNIKRCSRSENSELFEWTMGSMGLTGIIVKAAFKLRKIETAWIKLKKITVNSLDEAISIFESYNNSTYSVAWIDCLQKKEFGRSIIMLGEHAKIEDLDEKKKQFPLNSPRKFSVPIPFNLPSWFLNSWSVKLFNSIYFWKNKKDLGEKLVDWNSYFYPLDKVFGWNKIYGRRGFAQFQCVIPSKESKNGINDLIKAVQKAKVGCFLSVLKKFGPENGKFSFPMEGYTLALDFPINKKSLKLMDELDEITIKYGGRFYLAKDSRMSKKSFNQSEKRINSFKNFRDKLKNDKIFSSIQSKRLGL